MTDQAPETTARPRIMLVGQTRIIESPEMVGLDHEGLRTHLRVAYPEVANATIRERRDGEQVFVEFLPQPGRKG